jgi:ribonuclease R
MDHNSPTRLTRDFVLNFFLKSVPKPASFREISEMLALDREERPLLKRILRELASHGDLVYVKGKRFGLPMKMNLAVGILACTRDGVGYVNPERGGEEVLIRRTNMGGALHGDEVVARIEGKRSRGKLEGKVIRILQRAHRSLVGRYVEVNRFGCVVPIEDKILIDILIPRGESAGAEQGMLVEAEILDYPSGRGYVVGRVVRTFGYPAEPAIDLELIRRLYELPQEFPVEVLKEAGQVRQEVADADSRGREDLTGLLTVTIDGEDARDFDDAVSIERLRGKGYRLGVHIADVSHYVREGTALDQEAQVRGTSIYFPGAVIPMLPFELSNGVCSLNPSVARLAVSLILELDAGGEIVEYRLFPSVIKSAARLTYGFVEEVIEPGGEGRAGGADESVTRSLLLMDELARILKKKREDRGSLDFDLPESEFVRSPSGELTGIRKARRLRSHAVVEEFMILANEVVARHLEKSDTPFLYRIHEEPDEEDVRLLEEELEDFGLSFRHLSPAGFQKVLKALEGRPEATYLSHLMLRTLKWARYSEVNRGHFGLASRSYCHFTSPIRRYPDLVVHRILKEMLPHGRLKDARAARYREELPGLAVSCSRLERRAMEAERTFIERKKARFMENKVGTVFSGVVSSVASFGFFVELEEYFVEGLVHLTSIGDDYYHLSVTEHMLRGENRGRKFRVGDPVTVRVKGVDVLKGFVDFELVDPRKPDGPAAGQSRKRRQS